MRTCSKCHVEKDESEFSPIGGPSKGLRGDCKACVAEAMKRHRALPSTKARMKAYCSRPDVRAKANAFRRSDEGKESYRRRASQNPGFVLSYALYRAVKRRPTENPVTHAELLEMFHSSDGRCAVTGLKLTWMSGKASPTSISIDRIDNKKGYTKDNVRLVCYMVNLFRNRWDDETMYEMALAIVTNMKPKLRLVA